MTSADVVVESLGKRYGDVTAVQDVSFVVPRGETFGVIGPDGAGKTSLFRMLVTLLVPDAGRAVVLGHDVADPPWALRRRLGYMPGRFSLYQDLSVAENLAFYASVFDTSVADGMAIIAPIWAQIAPFATRRAGALSGGMKQKLALCCALVHRPDLLVLDEPTTGVDAVSRAEFWDLLGRLRESGLTMLVSTPYMDEASRCDRVLLLQDGRTLATAPPASLTAAYPRPLLAVRGGNRLGLLQLLRRHPHAATVWPFGDVVHFTDARPGADPAALAPALEAWAAAAGMPELRAEPATAGIEDVFMWHMAGAGAA
ncbi:MAG: ABC transporter ATP-binding protein [Gemmatimonadaceae bacterium]|jgi:ABC-type multidrug transport system ATPase subunit|nr:ABC transporter ATP-binding protein [Gemmatimonadaceae bacterium]